MSEDHKTKPFRVSGAAAKLFFFTHLVSNNSKIVGS